MNQQTANIALASDQTAVAPATAEVAEKRTFVMADRLVAATRPNSIVTESFRALRSTLLAQHVKLGRRSLVVCSPSPGAGCSFVAANLAVVMAQAGINTLLIDGNLRAPELDRYIEPGAACKGLADCLRDEDLPLSAAIQQPMPSLSVLYAGEADDAVADRLGSSVFSQMVTQCLRDFDLTIIDAPPSSLFADARRIAATTRYALVVARKNHTLVRDLKVLIDELEADGAKPVGTYLNDY